MRAPVFRAAPAELLLVEPLDVLTAVYHRASGQTHLLAEPAPEIMAALAGGPLTRDTLLADLRERYSMSDPDEDALAARLEELVAAGLVETL